MTTPDSQHFVQADIPLEGDYLCALAAVFRGQQVAAGQDPWFAQDPVPDRFAGSSRLTQSWQHFGPEDQPPGMFVERPLSI